MTSLLVDSAALICEANISEAHSEMRKRLFIIILSF